MNFTRPVFRYDLRVNLVFVRIRYKHLEYKVTRLAKRVYLVQSRTVSESRIPQQVLVSNSRQPGRPECKRRGCLTTTTFTPQPECRFSPPTGVIMVGLTLHLPSYLLIPFFKDEETVRIAVARLLGELPCEIE